MRLAFQVSGPPDAAPMVLLHGLTSDRTSFDAIVDVLAQRWQVFVPDQRGHGETGPASEYSFELLAEDLAEFIEEHHLRRPVLVGHSMGAVAAYLYAARHPHSPGALALVESPPPFPQQRPVPERPDGELTYDWRARAELMSQVNTPGVTWFEELGHIEVATLVVGGGDASPFPQEQMRQMAEQVPNGRFAQLPVGHGVHREAPGEFLGLLSRFLGQDGQVADAGGFGEAG